MKPFDLKLSAGGGVRLVIPLLGNVGFDWGYGFNRDDGARGKVDFLLGNVNFYRGRMTLPRCTAAPRRARLAALALACAALLALPGRARAADLRIGYIDSA